MKSLLEEIHSPSDLKRLSVEELETLAQEIRLFLIETVTKTGGHLGSSLGAVEITLALHVLLDSPRDKIVWDVSHQAYTHKILTGRRARFHTLRQLGGVSGFTSPDESPHDHFTVAHASTAIAQALGLAVARDYNLGSEHIVAVVGDGSLTGGLAFEGLNNLGTMERRLVIILNDNKMSIAPNVGAMSKYLNRILTAPLFNRIRDGIRKQVRSHSRVKSFLRHFEESLKNMLVPGILFEELGIRYFGPLDGHNLRELIPTIRNVLALKEPCLVHCITQKGRGCEQAQSTPDRLHGVSPQKPVCEVSGAVEKKPVLPFTKAFVRSLIKVAERDPRVVAITAAMPDGTGLAEFAKRFPDRCFDVGIAEQFAVCFAGALARAGLKPVCAIYSTFLQRALDQLIHDVALQHANVTLCIDRAGLVGVDGPTHQGLFDIGYLSSIPGSVIASPVTEGELLRCLELATTYDGLFAIRYPKDDVLLDLEKPVPETFAVAEGEIVREGADAALLALGPMAGLALDTARLLEADGLSAAVVNMRFAKPLDQRLLQELCQRFPILCTLEDHVITGGFGARVLEFLERSGLGHVPVRRFGVPERFVEHASRKEQFALCGLTAQKLAETIASEWAVVKAK